MHPKIAIPKIDRRFGILGYRLGFDTGVLRNVFRVDSKVDEQFWSDLLQLNNFKERLPFFFVTTLMCIEAVGLNIKNFDFYNNNEQFKNRVDSIVRSMTEENCSGELASILRMFKSEAEVVFRRKQNIIDRLLDQQISYQNPWSAELMNNLFRGNFEIERLAFAVAFDRLQAVPFEQIGMPNVLLEKLDLLFLNFAYHMFDTRRSNFSCARWFDVSRRRLLQLTEPLLYRPGGESLDTEIAHLVVTGHRDENRANKVCIFTNEKLESWYERIGHHITVIKHLSDVAHSVNKKIYVNPGYLFEVDVSTGRILDKYISVADHFDMDGLSFQPIPP